MCPFPSFDGYLHGWLIFQCASMQHLFFLSRDYTAGPMHPRPWDCITYLSVAGSSDVPSNWLFDAMRPRPSGEAIDLVRSSRREWSGAGQVGCTPANSLATRRNRKNPCVHHLCRVRLTRLTSKNSQNARSSPSHTAGLGRANQSLDLPIIRLERVPKRPALRQSALDFYKSGEASAAFMLTAPIPRRSRFDTS